MGFLTDLTPPVFTAFGARLFSEAGRDRGAAGEAVATGKDPRGCVSLPWYGLKNRSVGVKAILTKR